MKFFRQHRNHFYLGVTVTAIVFALILGLDYGVRRNAEKKETAGTVTAKTELEKRDRVLISINTEMIQDGLADMGVLVTQEYYFTQVETKIDN